MQVSSDQIEAFQRDGVVCVRGVASTDEVALVETGIERVLDEPSPLSMVASKPGDGLFVEDFCNWQRIPEFEQFITTSNAAAIAGGLMQTNIVRLYHDHVLVKQSQTAQKTPWHQDQPYYNVEGRKNVSMWMPVDPVAREASLDFVAGSHHGPWLMPRSFLDGESKWFPADSLEELPDIDGNRDDYRIVGWELEPGDAVFFHMLTLHAAAGVPLRRPRRVLSVRFLGDDMVHAPRPWRTSPPFPGLEDELAVGAPLDHPLFPILWEAGD
ncbi:MAG: phytanoyl-CoA dioxygenase family protein [Actinobacteria bacterium]|nr:phytanoyl-CoA dioxygenase family protein [Actinomycetota bacterium]